MQKKILVVEDNNFVRMQICQFLEDEGFQVSEARDGGEAIDAVSNGIDLAVVDVRMEPMDGFDFVRVIRSNGNRTPVIVITGDDNMDILEEASKLNIMAVLKKPVQKERLIKSVIRVLGIENQDA